MEITKEYFDEQLSKLATKADLETQKKILRRSDVHASAGCG